MYYIGVGVRGRRADMAAIETRRIESLNLRLSEREKAVLDTESRDAEGLSAWARKALLRYSEVFGQTMEWFFQADDLYFQKDSRGSDFYVSDGRVLLRVTDAMRQQMATDALAGYLSHDLLKKFS